MSFYLLAPSRARASSHVLWADWAELTCRRVLPEEEEEETGDGGGARIPPPKRESAMGPKLGGSRKLEDVGV